MFFLSIGVHHHHQKRLLNGIFRPTEMRPSPEFLFIDKATNILRLTEYFKIPLTLKEYVIMVSYRAKSAHFSYSCRTLLNFSAVGSWIDSLGLSRHAIMASAFFSIILQSFPIIFSVSEPS